MPICYRDFGKRELKSVDIDVERIKELVNPRIGRRQEVRGELTSVEVKQRHACS